MTFQPVASGAASTAATPPEISQGDWRQTLAASLGKIMGLRRHPYFGLPQGFLVAFGNFVGESTSTGPMVKKVNELKAAKPEEYKLLISDWTGRTERE